MKFTTKAIAAEEEDASANQLDKIASLVVARVASFRKKKNKPSASSKRHDFFVNSLSHSLKLYKRPSHYFHDFAEFLDDVIQKNHRSITSVEMSWIFFAALTEVQRNLLLTKIGKLPNLIKLQMEGTTAMALVAALQEGRCKKLAYLHIGSLRISNEMDVKALATALLQQKSLQQVFLANLSIKIEGRYQIDDEGGIRFEEIQNHPRSCPSIDPLLIALAGIPTLDEIDLQLDLNPSKIARIQDETLQTLCKEKTKHLMLQACNMDDQHCLAISQVSMEKIEVLSFTENNSISCKGWSILANMLETNYLLKYLETQSRSDTFSAPSQICRRKMDYYLKLNRAGRGELLATDGSRIGWTQFLIRGRDDLDLLYYTLLMNPSLCMNFF